LRHRSIILQESRLQPDQAFPVVGRGPGRHPNQLKPGFLGRISGLKFNVHQPDQAFPVVGHGPGRHPNRLKPGLPDGSLKK